jgi:hypothetical protein
VGFHPTVVTAFLLSLPKHLHTNPFLLSFSDQRRTTQKASLEIEIWTKITVHWG